MAYAAADLLDGFLIQRRNSASRGRTPSRQSSSTSAASPASSGTRTDSSPRPCATAAAKAVELIAVTCRSAASWAAKSALEPPGARLVQYAVTPPPPEGGGFSLSRLGFATDQPGP